MINFPKEDIEKNQRERVFDPALAHLNTDDAYYEDVLLAVGACADSWNPEVRLVGNVKAGDITRAIATVLNIEKKK